MASLLDVVAIWAQRLANKRGYFSTLQLNAKDVWIDTGQKRHTPYSVPLRNIVVILSLHPRLNGECGIYFFEGVAQGMGMLTVSFDDPESLGVAEER
jgi:hypothetical protein